MARRASMFVTVLLAAAGMLALAGCEKKPAPKQDYVIPEPAANSNVNSNLTGDVSKLPEAPAQDPYAGGSSGTVIVDPPIQTVQPVQPPTATGPRYHVAAKKDTYWHMAQIYYGDGKQWTRIQDANPAIPKDKIPVGARILIP